VFRRGVDKVGASVWRRAAAAGLGLAATLAGASHATPLPIPAFFELPAARGAQLSPSGRYLAMIETTARGDVVSVLDLQTRQQTVALRAKPDKQVDWVRWKGDDRLVTGQVAADGEVAWDGAPLAERGPEALTALGRDGSAPVNLEAPEPGARRARPVRIADALAQDPGHVLVEAPDAKGAPSLWKVDVRSGSAEFVRAGGEDLDARLPRGALVVKYDHRVRYQMNGDQQEFDVLGPADGGRRAFVALQPRTKADGDVATVRIYDFARKTLSEPVWPALKYDVSDVVYRDSDKSLAGVCYTADTFTCQFKDKSLEADWGKAEAFFHGLRNITPLSMSDDGRYWLLGVSGPDEPGAYYLMDRRSGKLTLAVDRHPDLPSGRLGRAEPYVYAARDGTPVPGYLTRPPGDPKGPLPLIVMPHGGPEARDSLGYDIWAQVFATRGYLVFQPNFRGSSGYGRAWAEAGYGQWGGRMQDDITDGVLSLFQSGQADPKRACIFGASFGGYAALEGGVETPQLYRCIASFAGVSDLEALVRWEKATPGHGGRYRYASRAIGDPKKDARKLEAASPIDHVGKYQVPVLLIHGSEDQSVPVIQSERMAQALKRAGKDVQLTVVKGEGHSDWTPEHEQAALAELVAFFQRNLGS
jgi:dienelactone hydrolase